MTYSPQEVLDYLTSLAEEVKLGKAIDGVIYRDDYQDYQVILDDNFHIELREKLIDIIMENPKHADTRREIIFLLQHAVEYGEWEEVPTGGGGGDIVID